MCEDLGSIHRTAKRPNKSNTYGKKKRLAEWPEITETAITAIIGYRDFYIQTQIANLQTVPKYSEILSLY